MAVEEAAGAVAAVEVVQVQDKIIIVILVVAALAFTAFLGMGISSGQLEPTGFAFGFILFVLPLLAIAAYLAWKMFSESKGLGELAKEQRVLDAIRSRGKTTVSELSRATGMAEPEVRAAVEGLVGKNLFTGYLNWKTGEIFSQEAAGIAGAKKCPFCGAQLEVVGKGMAKCAYCGAEIYA